MWMLLKKCCWKIALSEYEDVLLSKKSLRYLKNRIQSENHKIGTYEIHKMSWSCFDDKIYFPNNGFGGLALGDQS